MSKEQANMTTQEAANYLRVAPRTMENWRTAGTGPAYSKIGGRVVYSRAKLDEYFRAREVNPPTQAERGRG
jgi:excisionase family DNA binding protein